MENRRYCIAGVIVACLLLPALSGVALEAREDTASLVFQKSADPGKTTLYVVKKGDSLAAILRKQRGAQKKKVPYDLIRRLNPDLKDLNRIYPGQKIVLPLRENPELFKASRGVRKTSDSSLPGYTGKRHDPTPAAEPSPPAVRPEEKAPPETAPKTPPVIEHVLGIIRPVVSRMNGTLIAKGNYFIPLKEATQITIDCSLIPVVELGDGTTFLLDFGNRLSEEIKALIGQSWTNYAFLPGEELGDGLSGLKGIIRRSRNYAMSGVATPLVLIPRPEVRVFPDWTIETKQAAAGAAYRQGLFLREGDEKPLPAEVRSFLETNGLAVTEISGNRAVTGSSSVRKSSPKVNLRGLSGIALAEQLLKALGETPVAGTEIVLFDQARNGFNLTITADLLLRRGEKRFIIHTKKLPDQFDRILREGGAEVIPIGEGGSGRPIIEPLLQLLQIPVSFGHFAFRVPEEGNRPRITATFPALRVLTGTEPLYLLDFDITPDVLAFLSGLTGGRIATY